MDDSTIIAVVAIVTTGVTTGIAGPAITSWATTRGQKRKFKHERYLRDSAELRDLVDETAVALDELVRFTELGNVLKGSTDNDRSTQYVTDLQSRIETFERWATRLTIRTGPQSSISQSCSSLSAKASDLGTEITRIRMFRSGAFFGPDADEQAADPGRASREAYDRLRINVEELEALVPDFTEVSFKFVASQVGIEKQ